MPIHFFSEETSFQLGKPSIYKSWLESIVLEHQKKLGDVNYIFCSDDHLLEINKTHLDHDYYTDIITFDNSDTDDSLEADIFISIDRVRENAPLHGASFENELSRVLVHGLLHLLGYNDKTESDTKRMREKETAYISLLKK
ncbi:MAG: rRNA maturation RNase YbeY [Cyclobacteriaceae bacterium]